MALGDRARLADIRPNVRSDQHVTALGPITLSGQFIRLEPLRAMHRDALVEAAQDDRIWTWLPKKVQTAEAMSRYIDAAQAEEAKGTVHAFAVVLQTSSRVVGSTRYAEITPLDRGVEIGWTWYAPDVWGTQVNPEAKNLLMQHAFENWQAIRVFLKTDELNQRSRAAIAKLGAKFEGILRNHRIRPDGSYRGSAFYSVIDSEWPQVRARLLERLARARS